MHVHDKPVSVTPGQFSNDVQLRVEQLAAGDIEPGKFGAIDWSKLGNAAKALDGLVQKSKPVLDTLLPAQYDLFVNIAALALHAAVTGNVPAA